MDWAGPTAAAAGQSEPADLAHRPPWWGTGRRRCPLVRTASSGPLSGLAGTSVHPALQRRLSAWGDSGATVGPS